MEVSGHEDSPRISPMPTFPQRIVFLVDMNFRMELVQKTWSLPAKQWTGKRRTRLNIYDAGSLLVVDCAPAAIFLKRSPIPSEYVLQEVLFGSRIGAGEVVEYYYRSPMYSGLVQQKHLKIGYGEQVIAETVRQCSK